MRNISIGFALVLIFVGFSVFGARAASAQAMTISQLVEYLISSGIIPSEKAQKARVAFLVLAPAQQKKEAVAVATAQKPVVAPQPTATVAVAAVSSGPSISSPSVKGNAAIKALLSGIIARAQYLHSIDHDYDKVCGSNGEKQDSQIAQAIEWLKQSSVLGNVACDGGINQAETWAISTTLANNEEGMGYWCADSSGFFKTSVIPLAERLVTPLCDPKANPVSYSQTFPNPSPDKVESSAGGFKTKPSVKVTSLAGGSSVKKGSTVTLRWEISNPDKIPLSMTISAENLFPGQPIDILSLCAWNIKGCNEFDPSYRPEGFIWKVAAGATDGDYSLNVGLADRITGAILATTSVPFSISN